MSDLTIRDLADRARQERLRLGWTQAVAAAQVGVSRRVYERFEGTATVTLRHLIQVLEGLGLTLSIVPKAASAAPVQNPVAARLRQGRVRHARAATMPGLASQPAAKETSPSANANTDRRSASNTPSTPDSAAVARVAQQHGNAILMLVRAIVTNGLTNYTSLQVVRNIVNTERDLRETDRPAFVAAVESQLNGLNAENLGAYGLAKADYDRWSTAWNRDLGIANALAAVAR